jgi:hypothetical protein
LGGQNAIAPESRDPVVPAEQTAVMVDVPVLGRVDLHYVLTAATPEAARICWLDP